MRTTTSELTDDPIVAALRNWIIVSKKRETPIELDADLIGLRLLDSFDMVTFLLFIEELRGTEIPESLIHPRYFKSLRVIVDTFFDSTTMPLAGEGVTSC